MSLHVIHPPAVAALPERPPRPASARRSGDLLEPVAVPAAAAERVARSAAVAGVEAELAIVLLVEHRLALDAVQAAGAPAPDPPALRPACVAQGAADADYLRALTVAARPGPSTPRGELPRARLPVRLLSRCRPEVLERAAGGPLDDAIAFEVAAIGAGLTMTEWILRAALAAASAGRRDSSG